jgi:chromosome segregation ATPase
LELKKQLELVEEESHYKSKEMQQAIGECEELELEIARNNQLQTTSREEAAALKKKAKDLQDELATAAWALEEAEAEEESLRLQVVSSPDRRKAEMVHRRERLDKAKNECADLDKELQDSKTKIFHAKQISKEFELTTVTLDELQEQADKYTGLVRQLEETRDKIQAIKKQEAGHLQATEQVERELHRTEEKTIQQRKQHKMEINAVHEALEESKSQLLNVEKDRREGMARVEAGEAEVRELEAAMEEERLKTAREIEDMIEEYKETERMFLDRDAKRMAIIRGH